jgi:hypothetical protein
MLHLPVIGLGSKGWFGFDFGITFVLLSRDSQNQNQNQWTNRPKTRFFASQYK